MFASKENFFFTARYAEIAATWLQVARQVQIYFILAGSFCPDLRIKCREIAILVVLKLST